MQLETERLVSPAAQLERATRVRHAVSGAAFLLGLVLYLDRAAISVLAPAIRRELHLGPIAMGWVFSAFVWGYALFHLPAGWLGDRIGARRVLTVIVLLWSGFTAATALAWNLASLLVLRFLFGAAEAGATPNVSRAFSRWIPRPERARAQGVFLAGMGAGAALAAPLVTALLLWFGWRMAFVLVATVGLAWAIGWWIWYRDDPAQHAAVNAAELRIIGRFEEPPTGESMAWRALLTNPGMLAIVLMYFTYGYTGYIYITWFPTYLIEGRHLSPAWAGALAALPTALGVVAKPLGGLWSDKLVARRGLKWGRRVVGMFGFGLGAVAALPGILTPNAYMSAILLSCADGGAAIAHSVCFAVCLDVARNRAGTVAALMLTAGSIGNALSALAFGALLQWTGSWVPPFLIAVAANFAGALLWLRIDPEKPVI